MNIWHKKHRTLLFSPIFSIAPGIVRKLCIREHIIFALLTSTLNIFNMLTILYSIDSIHLTWWIEYSQFFFKKTNPFSTAYSKSVSTNSFISWFIRVSLNLSNQDFTYGSHFSSSESTYTMPHLKIYFFKFYLLLRIFFYRKSHKYLPKCRKVLFWKYIPANSRRWCLGEILYLKHHVDPGC